MKKLFVGAAVLAAMMTTSCQNDGVVVSQQNGKVEINASTVHESRTYVEGATVYWSAEDRILAYGEDVLGSLTLEGQGNSTDGKFVGYVSGNVNDLEYLIYPADMASYNEGRVTINIGTIDKTHSNAPMFAEYANSVIFKQLSAMVRIQVNNVPATGNNLTVSGKGIGTAVFVDGTLTCSTANNTIIVTGLTEGTNEICIPLFTSNIATAQNVDLTFTLAGASKTLSLPLKKGALTANSVPVLTYDETNKTLNEQTTLPEGGEDGEEGFVISTLTELVQFANMVNAGNNFEGQTVTLGANIDLNNQPWTPIGTGAASDANENIFCGTFDGGNFTISNLNIKTEGDNAAGLFAASLGTIKNLKIEGVNIEANYKAGAVVGDGVASEIENCHVNGGSIILTPLNGNKGNHAGGIVGYLSAEPSANVKNCSVDGLEIRAYRDLGGIVGTATGDGGTPEISGNVVTNTVIIADQTAEYNENPAENMVGYAANAGAICGRNVLNVSFGSYTISNVTVETLVATAEQLTNAIKLASGDVNITFANDIEGNAIAEQKQSIKVNIDGREHKMNGTITIDGKSKRYETAALTIKNINFAAENLEGDAYIRMGDPKNINATRYTNNVTVEKCTFDFLGGKDVVAIKSYTGGDYNLKVYDCVATENMHSLVGVTNVEKGLEIKGCEVYSGSGVNLNNTPSLLMEGCTFDVKGYAVRFGVDGTVGGDGKLFEIKYSTLKSACEDGDAVIVFRDNAKMATLKLIGTELVGVTKFAGVVEGTNIVKE